MRVLVACEYSGRVREAFRKKGHDVYSCDYLESLDGSPHHIVGDARLLLGSEWDLLIAHPPCTYLCNSGVRWLTNQYDYVNNPPDTHEARREEQRVSQRWLDLTYARAFFLTLWNAPIPKIVIENPIPHKYAHLPKYSQTIQPYWFGDNASKRTCLWLKGLDSLLVPPETSWASPHIVIDKNGLPHKVYGTNTWSEKAQKVVQTDPRTEDRGHLRSLTYPGIAEAFAKNWG